MCTQAPRLPTCTSIIACGGMEYCTARYAFALGEANRTRPSESASHARRITRRESGQSKSVFNVPTTYPRCIEYVAAVPIPIRDVYYTWSRSSIADMGVYLCVNIQSTEQRRSRCQCVYYSPKYQRTLFAQHCDLRAKC